MSEKENDSQPTPIPKTVTVDDKKLQALLNKIAVRAGFPDERNTYCPTPGTLCSVCWLEYLKGGVKDARSV